HATLLVVDFFHDAIEIVERALGDADHLARLEQHLQTWLLDTFLNTIQDGSGLFVTNRQRAISGTADETHDLRGFLHQVPAFIVDTRNAGFFVGFDLDQHITLEKLALGTALLAGTHLDHFFRGNQNVAEKLLHFVTRDAVTQRLRYRLLKT